MITTKIRSSRINGLFVLLGAAVLYGCGDGTAPPETSTEARAEIQTPPVDSSRADSSDATTDPPAEVQSPEGSEILRRHVLAAGGDAVPPDGTSRTLTYEVDFVVPGAPDQRIDQPRGEMTVRRMAPNLLHTRTTVPGIGAMQGGYDGQRGWSFDGTNIRDLEGHSLAEIQREAVFDREIHLDLVYPSATLMGEIDRDGVRCWRVNLIAEDGTQAHGFFSVETGLLHELARQLPAPGGTMTVMQRFTEWEEFDGRRFPTRVETRMGGTIQTMVLTDVDSSPLQEVDFAPPGSGEPS